MSGRMLEYAGQIGAQARAQQNLYNAGLSRMGYYAGGEAGMVAVDMVDTVGTAVVAIEAILWRAVRY